MTETFDVTLTIDVDPEAWVATYGDDHSLRSELAIYVRGQVYGSAAAEEGCITGVAIKRFSKKRRPPRF